MYFQAFIGSRTCFAHRFHYQTTFEHQLKDLVSWTCPFLDMVVPYRIVQDTLKLLAEWEGYGYVGNGGKIKI